MKLEPPHKILVTGTGRAGTTFLVRLFTALGLPTGYTDRNWRKDYFGHCAAGLERNVSDPDSPYIVKDPQLCETLAGLLQRHAIVVDHVFVPVRDLTSAALSRVRVGGHGNEIPGGLVGTDKASEQENVLGRRFHTLVYTIVNYELPHTLLHFPRFAQDPEYTFEKLTPVFPQISRTAFARAFAASAEPALVHTYRAAETAAEPSIAARFRRDRSRAKRWRRVRRIAAWSLGLTAAAAFGHWGWITMPNTHPATISTPPP